MKPIQMRWDARGRLWVIGSTTYPQIKPGEVAERQGLDPRRHQGRRLRGQGDGLRRRADDPDGLEIAPGGLHGESGLRATACHGERTISQTTQNPVALAVCCYVGEGTKLWLMTDTDGDGKADQREVVLRGFGTGDNHQNINSFRWSPGGELMFCQGLHAYSRVETPHGIVALDAGRALALSPARASARCLFRRAADPQNPWGWIFTQMGRSRSSSAGNSGRRCITPRRR